jgi:hypothetical protein
MESKDIQIQDRERIKIQWIGHLSGDFSFRHSRSIQSEAWCYEYAGTDRMKAYRRSDGRIECYTMQDAATHCSLNMIISNEYCYPQIELTSIATPGKTVYRCTGGFIVIDRRLYEHGILKASFSFEFYNSDDPEQPMYWKGKLYTKILK